MRMVLSLPLDTLTSCEPKIRGYGLSGSNEIMVQGEEMFSQGKPSGYLRVKKGNLCGQVESHALEVVLSLLSSLL